MTTPFGQFGPIGFPELLVFALVLLLLFGHRLPGVMRSLGRGIIEFKKGLSGQRSDNEPTGDNSVPNPNEPPADRESGDAARQ